MKSGIIIRSEVSAKTIGSIKELKNKIDNVVEEYVKIYGQPPDTDYIAEKVNVGREGVEEAMRAGIVPIDEIDFSKIVNIRYNNFKVPIEDRIILENAIRKLNKLQKKVVNMLFYRDMTQQQTADELGISQRKVSRELKRSINTMKQDIVDDINE